MTPSRPRGPVGRLTTRSERQELPIAMQGTCVRGEWRMTEKVGPV